MEKRKLAYVIGLALGDGNLSNPNGRAVRLRITCDTKYKNLIDNIVKSIKDICPRNKINIVKGGKPTYVDISCYSNRWEDLLGWKAKGGSKYKQKASVPIWIKESKRYIIPCVRGLFETDGSEYFDRGYKMFNFVTMIPTLATDVMDMLEKLSFKPRLYKLQSGYKIKHTIRIARDVIEFKRLIKINKT